ncbi:MAG: hypothetical protein NTV93_18395, partial [Verrucomicrobia bacterium]|nr:hypothetical protein [Verrucomicrobiota bacterium]
HRRLKLPHERPHRNLKTPLPLMRQKPLFAIRFSNRPNHPTFAPAPANISVFGSLAQTAALQGAKVIDMFRSLFRSSPIHAQDVIFASTPKLNLSG